MFPKKTWPMPVLLSNRYPREMPLVVRPDLVHSYILSMDPPAPCVMRSRVKARNALCANIAHFFHTCNGGALNTDKGLLQSKKRANVSRREWIRVIVISWPQEANRRLPVPSWREDAAVCRAFFLLTVRTDRFFLSVVASCHHF